MPRSRRWRPCWSSAASAMPARSSAPAASPRRPASGWTACCSSSAWCRERGLAEAYAALLDLPVADAGALSGRAPLLADALTGALPAPGARPAGGAGRRDAGAGAGRSAGPLHPGRDRRGDRPCRARWRSPCRSSSKPRSNRLYPETGDDGTPPRRTADGEPLGGGRRAAEGPGERGAGHPAGQPDHRPRGRDPGLRHPYRAVRGPAAGALPL